MRVWFAQGWYIVTYGLGIYMLNLFIGFLTPRFDPSLAEVDDDDPGLPTRNDEEFRPFTRRVREFKFWYSSMKATFIALCMSMFKIFDIPVFWPILLIYFIALFCLTMNRQIKHMMKHNYLPFDIGKTKYSGKEESNGKVYGGKGK